MALLDIFTDIYIINIMYMYIQNNSTDVYISAEHLFVCTSDLLTFFLFKKKLNR